MDPLSSFPWLYQGCHKGFICHLSLWFLVLTISENNFFMITLTVFRSFDNIVCRAPLVRINWCFSYKHIGRKTRAVKYHLHLIIFMAWYIIKIYDWRFHTWSCSKSSAHQVYLLYSHYFILELHIVKSVIVCTFFHNVTYIPTLYILYPIA